MLIRSYQAQDWRRICEIHDRARIDELRLSVGEAAFLPLDVAAENEGLFDHHVCVAEVDGRVEGFVAFSRSELSWLYVAPDAHRHGIGRALLRHALAYAGPLIAVEVLEGNSPALELYLAEGFRIVDGSSDRLAGNEAFAATALVLQYVSPPG